MQSFRAELLDPALSLLQRLVSERNPTEREHLTESFMKRIYELGRRLTEDPALRESSDLQAFVKAAADPLEKATGDIGMFRYSIENMLLDTWEFREWPELAWRRSAVEFLLQIYAGTPLEQWLRHQIEPETNDNEIRAKAVEQNFLKPTDVPTGIPESHWWWRRDAS